MTNLVVSETVRKTLQPLAVKLHEAYQAQDRLQRMEVGSNLTLGALYERLEALRVAREQTVLARKAFWDAWGIFYADGCVMWNSYTRYLPT